MLNCLAIRLVRYANHEIIRFAPRLGVDGDQEMGEYMKRISALLLLLTAFVSIAYAAFSRPIFYESVPFVGGIGGYTHYRIPAIAYTENGVLLAFANGMRDWHDGGDIDLLLKRSFDLGRTWEPTQLIKDAGADSFTGSCVVVDRNTNRVFLLAILFPGDRCKSIKYNLSNWPLDEWPKVYLLTSDNDGLTWSEPRDITSIARPPNTTWWCFAQMTGIQLRNGRLIIPVCWMTYPDKHYITGVLYSDDSGETWQRGGSFDDLTNEAAIVELPDGKILMNLRSFDSHAPYRKATSSTDGGLSWEPVTTTNIPDPFCQGALTESAGTVYLSNIYNSKERRNLVIHASQDDGESWTKHRTLYRGPAAYSALINFENGDLGCFYEAGWGTGIGAPYGSIRFSRFNKSWVFAGK